MKAQRTVAAFIEQHDMESDPAFRLLDVAAEVGEIAADATESTQWGTKPGALEIETDELGDALFSLLALAHALDVDAGDALAESLAKYERRITETGDASSDV